jgi:membrane associated rhomboid family serine protease
MSFQVKYHLYKLKNNFPIATASIIALCTVIYVFPSLMTGPRFFQSLIYASSPGYVAIEEKLFFIPALAMHEPWRILTGAFLHASALHIILNLYALAIIGIPIERVFGKARFLCIYFLSALGASLCITVISSFFDKSGEMWVTPTVGASGAIFGLLGATFFIVKKLNAPTANITSLIVINIIIGFSVPNISWQGHLGGLVTGGLIGWLFINMPYNRQKKLSILYCGAIAAILIFLIFLTLSLSGLPNY